MLPLHCAHIAPPWPHRNAWVPPEQNWKPPTVVQQPVHDVASHTH
jgi:hypothetical protein